MKMMKMKTKEIDKYMKQLQKEVKLIEDKSELKQLGRLKKDLKNIRATLRRTYSKYEKEGVFQYQEFEKYDRKADLDRYIVKVMQDTYKDIISDTDETLNRITKATIDKMAELSEIPAIKKTVNIERTVNKDMAGLKWTERYDKSRDDFIYDLQSTIKGGLQQGETYSSMSKQLQERFAVEAYKIDRVVRTESHRVLNDAKIQTLEEINKLIPIKKKWVANLDERVRVGHAELDGSIVDIDENFIASDGATGKGPGQMNAPQHDINCRCYLTIEIEKQLN